MNLKKTAYIGYYGVNIMKGELYNGEGK